MDCKDCPYYNNKQCKYGADHIICTTKLKQAKNDKRRIKNEFTIQQNNAPRRSQKNE